MLSLPRILTVALGAALHDRSLARKVGLLHPKWIEDPRLQRGCIRTLVQLFDDHAQYLVTGVAVVPFGPWSKVEGRL